MSIVFLDPTGRCNLRCRHCYARSRWTFHPSKETLLRTIRRLPEGLDVGLIGGESMVRRDIVEVVQACVQNGHRTTLATNATLIDECSARALRDVGIAALDC